MKQFLQNQFGNSIATVMVGFSILGALSYAILTQTNAQKKSVKSIQLTKDRLLLEAQIKSYLVDIDTCRDNFLNQNVTRSFNQITKNGKNVIEVDKLYSNGSVKILDLKTQPNDANSFFFIYQYEKLKAGNLGSQSIERKIKMSATVSGGIITSPCYMDEDNEITDLYNNALSTICDTTSPGHVSGQPACTIVDFTNLSTSCPAGQASRSFIYNPAGGFDLELDCASPITNFSDQVNGSGVIIECPEGLKYTNNAGQFACFTLSEMVDTTSTITIGLNDTCGIALNASDKFSISCTCSPLCPIPAQVCSGTTDTRADGCGGSCSVVGTATPVCPAANTICSGESYNGPNGCGGNCSVAGTQVCSPSLAVDGVCGPAHGNPRPPAIDDLCTTGPAINQLLVNGELTWDCDGIDGGVPANCSTTSPDGVCGTLRNTCTAGIFGFWADTPSLYRWKCLGGANNDNCSIARARCGSADGGTCSGSAPSNPTLCGPGSTPTGPPTPNSGWEWVCETPQGDTRSCSCAAGGCFTAGTEISLFNGKKKNIEDVDLKDILMGTDGEPVKIEKLISHPHNGYLYSINGGPHFITGGHPIKTTQGWKAFEPELAKKETPQLEVGQIQIGDFILTENGIEILSHTDKRLNQDTVYNFHVSGKNEYMADGIQVHNKCDLPACTPPQTLNCGGFYTPDQCRCAGTMLSVTCCGGGVACP